MEAWQIILIVCGGLLLLFVLFVILVRRSNRKRYYKLQENLRKFQKENEDFDSEGEPDVMPGLKITEDPVELPKTKKGEPSPIVEEYIPEFSEEIERPIENDIMEDENDFKYQPSFSNEMRRNNQAKRDEEFENFMNEHSFSRKVLDQNLVAKIRNLPPELKAIILNSVFDKFDDNK